MPDDKPVNAFDVVQRTLDLGGRAIGLLGEAVGDKDLKDVGDIARGAASQVPLAREQIKEALVEGGSEAGRKAGRTIFGAIDGTDSE